MLSMGRCLKSQFWGGRDKRTPKDPRLARLASVLIFRLRVSVSEEVDDFLSMKPKIVLCLQYANPCPQYTYTYICTHNHTWKKLKTYEFEILAM